MKPRVLGFAATLLVLACSVHDKTVAPPPPLPPSIEAVFPVSRATGIDFDTEIWAQFREPLDPATVSDHTVFLKVDSRRLSAAVTYDTTSRRVRIRPLEPLLLRRTHTVEVSPQVRSAAGAELRPGYDWQFTTVGVRVPVLRGPIDRDDDESPVAALVWRGTESDAGPVSYDVYAGLDSAQVAGRVGVPWSVTHSPEAYVTTPWPFDAMVYWSVLATNVQTGERRSGPVWSFRVLPASWPIDTLSVPLSHWGFVDNRSTTGQRCQSTLSAGPNFLCCMNWRFTAIDPSRRVAAVRWTAVLSGTSSVDPTNREPSLWSLQDPWQACQLVAVGPPFVDEELGPLASGQLVFIGTTRVFTVQSNKLASHVDGAIRYGTSNGYAVRAAINTNYNAPSSDGFFAMRYFFYYRP